MRSSSKVGSWALTLAAVTALAAGCSDEEPSNAAIGGSAGKSAGGDAGMGAETASGLGGETGVAGSDSGTAGSDSGTAGSDSGIAGSDSGSGGVGGGVGAAGAGAEAGTGGASGTPGGGGTGGQEPVAPECSTAPGFSDGSLTTSFPELGARALGDLPSGVVRIDRDPLTGDVVYMTMAGDFYLLDLDDGTSAPTEADYPTTGTERGMAYGPDGTLYVLSTQASPISATIHKGVPNGGGRTWTTLATTQGYTASSTNFDHNYSALAVSPDGTELYVSSGARTDHGEVEAGLREVPLSSAVLRVPTSGNDLTLMNDAGALANYLFADGLHNAFDLAFNAEGELFAPDTGPDMDLPEELNWLREGLHYGFPWRFGAEANPVLDPSYNPATDQRLQSGYQAVDMGLYAYDANFPTAPAAMVDSIKNNGPDADKFKSGPSSGVIDASDTAMPFYGLSGHRTPLGLTFDVEGALCGDYYKSGLLLSFGAVVDEFTGEGNDLLLIQLDKVGDEYQMNATRLVTGFEYPIDAVLVGNKLYVVEFGADAKVSEITFPLPN